MFPVSVLFVAKPFEPTPVLLPLVGKNRAFKRTATLCPEVWLRLMALLPTATLPLPVVLAESEPDPTDVLTEPVVVAFWENVPSAVLEPPLVQASRLL